MKEKVQVFGRFLSGMVMPNIGAFIAWGLITALFIETGWCPNETFAGLVGPMSQMLLPLLIAYTGGEVVAGKRGGVIGAIAAMGVIVGSDIPMFIGAMIAGPLAAWILKKFDAFVQPHIRAGFEMLVNNFSLGIIGALLALAAMKGITPLVTILNNAMSAGVGFFVDHGLLPLASVFIEPAKVLFLNNAINHGILSPMGIQQVKEFGKSVFFLLATIAGGAGGILVFDLFDVGLTSAASPGSILAILLMAERHSYPGLILGVFVAAVISFVISVPILKFMGRDTSLEEAQQKKDVMKRQAKGTAAEAAAAAEGKTAGRVHKIAFACDAGMGFSAMGATVLKKKIAAAGMEGIEVIHTPVSSIPKDVEIVVTHQELGERAAHSNPDAELVLITNFLAAPEYELLIKDLQERNR